MIVPMGKMITVLVGVGVEWRCVKQVDVLQSTSKSGLLRETLVI
jgi:hypothetical protein